MDLKKALVRAWSHHQKGQTHLVMMQSKNSQFMTAATDYPGLVEGKWWTFADFINKFDTKNKRVIGYDIEVEDASKGFRFRIVASNNRVSGWARYTQAVMLDDMIAVSSAYSFSVTSLHTSLSP